MLYVVVDCYPQPGSEAFRHFAAATARCWISADVCGCVEHVDGVVGEKLRSAGWNVARTLVREVAASGTYAAGSAERVFFDQAEIDGFVVHFDVFTRLSIGDTTLDDDNVVDALMNLPGKAGIQGGFSFYSDLDGQ